MRDFVYPPVVVTIKTVWKYLGLKFDFRGSENIPATGGANQSHWLSRLCANWNRGSTSQTVCPIYGKERDI